MLQTGISAGVGVLCLVAAAILITAGSWQWPRLIVALVLTGVAGLANATFAGAVQRSVTRLDGKVGGFIGEWTGAAVTGVIGLTLIGLLGFWVWKNRIDIRTVGVAAAVPFTVTLIPGPLGVFLVSAVAVVPLMLGGVVAWLFGAG